MNLVSLRHEEAVCTSLDVAEKFEKKHKHVLEKIEKILAEDSAENSAQCFSKSTYTDGSGKKNPMYYMNRDGFTFLVMGFTGKRATEWKWKYIEAFNEMEKVILNQKNAEWLYNREHGKICRKVETDALKEFVQYATNNGSENGDRYYTLFTKMANSFAGVTKRDFANAWQLWRLSVLENAIANLVIEEIEEGIDYHKIYRDCKERLALIQNLAYLKG